MDFLDHLLTFVSENRKTKFEEILQHRTRHLTVVLEDIYQPQNASAVLRSCDCFGIQDIHIIENRNEFQLNPDVTQGCSKWLSLYNYNERENNTTNCLNTLKEKGYKLIATTPHEEECMIDDLDVGEKTALVFGTEMTGLSKTALDVADGFVKVPLYGFTESYNISVSAALCLFSFSERMRESKADWHLSKHEIEELKLEWAKKTVKRADLIEKDFIEKNKPSLH